MGGGGREGCKERMKCGGGREGVEIRTERIDEGDWSWPSGEASLIKREIEYASDCVPFTVVWYLHLE